jgi:transposase
MGQRDPKDVQRIEELEAQVASLTDLLAKAMARIAELEERLNKNSTNSSKPPSSDPPGTGRSGKKASGRKPGGQPGHPKHERTFLKPDHIVPVRPKVCNCCGGPLHENEVEPERRQIIEMPKVRPDVTDYLLYFGSCDRCGAVSRAELPPGVPRRGYGPRLTAMVSLCSGKYRLSKRLIQSLLADLLGIDLSLGSVSNLEQEISASLAAPVEEACAHVHEQGVVNADETGWYEGRSNGRAGRAWLWVVTTALVTVFRVARSRGAEIARELLGESFAGLLGTDRWSAYAWVDAVRRQLCWSHLVRDFQGFVDRSDAGTSIGERLLRETRRMFRYWHRIRDGTLTREAFQHRMKPVRARILSLLREASVCPAAKTAGMAKEILKLQDALFTFVDREGIDPTNNISERKVRHGVMWRKTSFGTQGSRGSRFVERILTADATLRQQGRDVLDFLTAACQARLDRAPAPSLLPTLR